MFVTGQAKGAIELKFQPGGRRLANPTKKCHLCENNEKEVSMIQCDRTYCQKDFHVRCAINHGIITHWHNMDA